MDEIVHCVVERVVLALIVLEQSDELLLERLAEDLELTHLRVGLKEVCVPLYHAECLRVRVK